MNLFKSLLIAACLSSSLLQANKIVEGNTPMPMAQAHDAIDTYLAANTGAADHKNLQAYFHYYQNYHKDQNGNRKALWIFTIRPANIELSSAAEAYKQELFDLAETNFPKLDQQLAGGSRFSEAGKAFLNKAVEMTDIVLKA